MQSYYLIDSGLDLKFQQNCEDSENCSLFQFDPIFNGNFADLGEFDLLDGSHGKLGFCKITSKIVIHHHVS
jgi:hypothetical protein